MVPNPSHLEASHPVIMGKARSRFLTKQQAYYNGENENSEDELLNILSIQVHGDAAMAGQVLQYNNFSLRSYVGTTLPKELYEYVEKLL